MAFADLDGWLDYLAGMGFRAYGKSRLLGGKDILVPMYCIRPGTPLADVVDASARVVAKMLPLLFGSLPS